jgi:hypothetical protein
MSCSLQNEVDEVEGDKLDTNLVELVATSSSPSLDARLNETRQQMAKAHDFIRSLYHAGVPFFTKQALRDVAEQLARCEKDGMAADQRIGITGLNGVTEWFPVDSGRELRSPSRDSKYKRFM